MDRKLTICFTSDVHGYFSDMDYAQGIPGTTGLVRCASAFPDNGNTLILDGGDTLQGSPFAYWLSQKPVEGAKVAARAMSLAGYDFVTIGNHDFNYGKATLESYLSHLDARCISANVEGVSGVERTAVVKLQNGTALHIRQISLRLKRHSKKKQKRAFIPHLSSHKNKKTRDTVKTTVSLSVS